MIMGSTLDALTAPLTWREMLEAPRINAVTAYTWISLPRDTGDVPPALGLCDNLDKAREYAGAAVLDGRAFAASVQPVRLVRCAVAGMHYEECGRQLTGILSGDGKSISWMTQRLPAF
jgi:hypothetical protein